MALVNFHRLDAAAYTSLDPKQPDTIYFVTDARRIYMGSKEYGLQIVSGTRPGTGSLNTLYIDSAAHTISYWNGTGYDSLEIPFGTTISGAGDDAHLATTKAVVDYVASQVAGLDVGALKGRVDTLEDEMDAAQASITTITGEGEGSIKKAASDAQTTAVAAAKSYTDQEVAKKANLEHTHEIDDVTGLQDALDGKANTVHTHTTAQVDGLDTALAGKADKSTTLAGYGIGDAYTKGQTDSAIAAAVAAAPHLKRTIVEELPDTEGADENTIYMVPQSGSVEDPGTSTSHYNEYMLINGAFELIGSSQVDLSGYATETFVTGAINALDVADTAVANQYVSQVVETDGKIAVTRVPLPVTSVTEGSANGTIAVNGADVNVHGLGSAAYTDAAAYETAGAAAAAVAALDKEDTAVPGQYVSAVSQENGVITVQRAALPTAPEITTGGTNGTIKVGEKEVAVAGLKSAAYTEASAYATAAQGALADSAVQTVVEGTTNGTILVDGAAVAVHGLGSAAYTETTAYATAAQGTKADKVFAALTWQEG